MTETLCRKCGDVFITGTTHICIEVIPVIITTIRSLETQGITSISTEDIRNLHEYRNGELKYYEAIEVLRKRGIEVTGIKERKKKNEKT